MEVFNTVERESRRDEMLLSSVDRERTKNLAIDVVA